MSPFRKQIFEQVNLHLVGLAYFVSELPGTLPVLPMSSPDQDGEIHCGELRTAENSFFIAFSKAVGTSLIIIICMYKTNKTNNNKLIIFCGFVQQRKSCLYFRVLCTKIVKF